MCGHGCCTQPWGRGYRRGLGLRVGRARASVSLVPQTPRPQYTRMRIYRGGVEGPASTANAVPLFTVVCIAVPLFKAGRTGAANVPPRMRDCSARAYSTYAWASTVKLILTKAIV